MTFNWESQCYDILQRSSHFLASSGAILVLEPHKDYDFCYFKCRRFVQLLYVFQELIFSGQRL